MPESVTSTVGAASLHAVWIGVSTHGGNSFTDHTVYVNPNTSVSYGHQFVNVSVDWGGNVYAVFSDNHTIFYSFSSDHGATWSAPVQVNQVPSNTAIIPWGVAGDAGKFDVV
jgi:Neuraminidase (sialidase)